MNLAARMFGDDAAHETQELDVLAATEAYEAGPLRDRAGYALLLSTRSLVVSMTGTIDRVEVIPSVQRRRA